MTWKTYLERLHASCNRPEIALTVTRVIVVRGIAVVAGVVEEEQLVVTISGS
jgi:hypothetical protein